MDTIPIGFFVTEYICIGITIALVLIEDLQFARLFRGVTFVCTSIAVCFILYWYLDVNQWSSGQILLLVLMLLVLFGIFFHVVLQLVNVFRKKKTLLFDGKPVIGLIYSAIYAAEIIMFNYWVYQASSKADDENKTDKTMASISSPLKPLREPRPIKTKIIGFLDKERERLDIDTKPSIEGITEDSVIADIVQKAFELYFDPKEIERLGLEKDNYLYNLWPKTNKGRTGISFAVLTANRDKLEEYISEDVIGLDVEIDSSRLPDFFTNLRDRWIPLSVFVSSLDMPPHEQNTFKKIYHINETIHSVWLDAIKYLELNKFAGSHPEYEKRAYSAEFDTEPSSGPDTDIKPSKTIKFLAENFLVPPKDGTFAVNYDVNEPWNDDLP